MHGPINIRLLSHVQNCSSQYFICSDRSETLWIYASRRVGCLSWAENSISLSRNSVVCVVTTLRAGRPRRFPAGARDFRVFLFRKYRGCDGDVMKVTICPYLMPRLRMSRAIPLLLGVPWRRAQRRLLYAELYAIIFLAHGMPIVTNKLLVFFQLEPLLWTRTSVWAQRTAVPATHLVKVGVFALNISIRNWSWKIHSFMNNV